jgi:hypothetical protein
MPPRAAHHERIHVLGGACQKSIRYRRTPLCRVRRDRRRTEKEAQAASNYKAEGIRQQTEDKKPMATQGQPQNTKSKIVGLLEIRKHRGLEGRVATESWIMAALETLIEAELARIEKREKDNA